jgi:hypothetical protein
MEKVSQNMMLVSGPMDHVRRPMDNYRHPMDLFRGPMNFIGIRWGLWPKRCLECPVFVKIGVLK